MPFRPRRANRAGRPRGQSLAEFALVAPVFMLLLLIAIDFGRVFFSHIQITNAAREAAAYGATSPTDTVGIAARARQERNVQSQRGESALVISSSCANGVGGTISCSTASGGTGAGNTITVRVGEAFTFLTPLIGGFFGSFEIGAASTATVLGYASDASGPPPGGCSPPTASFSVAVVSGTSIFADPSASSPNSGVCNISGYNWDWGDGTQEPGNASGLEHTYAGAGTYTVRLQVTNQAGSATAVANVTVPAGVPPPPCEKPVANFTGADSDNGSNRVIALTDTSTVDDPVNCPIQTWAWLFNGEVRANSQNTSYRPGNNAQVTVELTVTNAGGTSVATRTYR